RKFAARMQSRIGPYYVGRPHGWLQPIADALKLMMKEDIVPTASDRWVYNLAPIVFLVPCLLIFATIPFAPELGVADLNIGVLFFLAVSSLVIVGLFMGGWGSNNKDALPSAMPAVNQIISYDLPFIFAALVPVLLAGSLRMSAIVTAQQGLWFVAYPVIGQLAFIAFLVATLAAENRVPFDILEAESELVAGFRVEYSGMKFALIQLGEYAHMLGTSFLGALLFLGGWLGPGPAWLGPLWCLMKAVLIFLVVTWVRWSFVRIRVDQILGISWKLLLPATLMLLMATGFVVALRGGGGAYRRGAGAGILARDGPAGPGRRTRDGRHAAQPVPQAGHRPLSGRPAPVSGPVPGHPRPRLREGPRRGGLHRLPPLRVHLPAAGHQGRDAEDREAELRQDLHARAVLVRVLRAVRPGVPDRRDHHDEVVRSGHGRSPRSLA